MKKMEKLEKTLNLYDELLELDENASYNFDFMDSISEQSKSVEIDNAYSELLKIRTALNAELKAEESNGFKWITAENFKRLLLKNVTFDGLKNGDRIIFHYTKKARKYLEKNGYFYGETDTPAAEMIFNDNQDVTEIINIDGDEITAKSILTGALYYVYRDNIETDSKSKKCVTDCGIPSMCFSKIAYPLLYGL